MHSTLRIAGALAVGALLSTSSAFAQAPLETSISYQGYLTNNGATIVGPVNQPMTFRLYDVAAGGTALQTLSNVNVSITNSLFTVPLPFTASLWEGSDRWIEIQIGTQILTPRQKVRPVPYALYALNAAPGTCAPWDCSGANVFNTNTGNVGVGTTTPERKLHVADGSAGAVTAVALASAVFERNSTNYLQLLSPNDSERGILFGDPANTSSGAIVYDGAGASVDRMSFRTGGNVERMFIGATGNIGIGTSTPSGRLHVRDGASGGTPNTFSVGIFERSQSGFINILTPSGTQRGILFGSELVANDGGVVFDTAAAPSGMEFRTGNNNTKMTITSAGNVGVGTSTPAQKLSVVGTVQSTTGGFMFPDGTVQTTASTSGSGPWSINGTNIFSSNTGNVGIGINAPTEKLHIKADVADNTSLRIENLSTSTAASASVVLRTGGTGQPAAVASITLPNTTAADTDLTIDAGSLNGITTTSFGFSVKGRGNAAGWMGLYAADDVTRTLALNGGTGSTGGVVELYNPAGTVKTVNILGTSAGEGSILEMYNAANVKTILLDSAEGLGRGAQIEVRNAAGTPTIVLDGDYGNTNVGRITTQVLEITGGSDLSEQFDVTHEAGAEPQPGMVVSIDPKQAGKLAVANKAYDRRVAGVISGAGGVNTGMLMGQKGSTADGRLPVALTGRVYVLVDADLGAVEPGDLLTSSATPGHAMVVRDHAAAQGAILGKAMTSLESGKGLVMVLVNLQ